MMGWDLTTFKQSQLNEALTFAVDFVWEVTCSRDFLSCFNPVTNIHLNINHMLNFPKPISLLIAPNHHGVIVGPEGGDIDHRT